MSPFRSRWLPVIALLLAACDPADGSDGHTGGQGGSGGQGAAGGQGGSGGPVACDASTFGEEGAEAEVSIVIHNQRDVPVFIPNDCYAPGVDGVRIDGRSMDTWNRYLCTEAEAGTCGSFSLDCHGNGRIELGAGETLTVQWDGRVEVDFMIPKSCGLDDCPTMGGPPIQSCTQLTAAAPGSHQVEVGYFLDAAPNDPLSASVDFDFPAGVVDVVIAP